MADVVEKYRPQVERKYLAIASLKDQLEATPEFQEARVNAPGEPLLLEKEGDDDNAMFIYAQDVENPRVAHQIDLRTLDSLPLLHCGALLDRSTAFDSREKVSSSVAEGYLAACARLRFILVIRAKELVPPRAAVGATTFTRGHFIGDVVVFDVATGKMLGGFPVSAQNADDVTIVSGENQQQRLLRNLEGAIYYALRGGLRKAFPGSVPRRPAP